MAADLIRVSRALISVSDKTGLIPLGKALAAHGVVILSTGGTAKALAEAGVPVQEVSDHTGFPEIMDGRERRCTRDSMAGFWPCVTMTRMLRRWKSMISRRSIYWW